MRWLPNRHVQAAIRATHWRAVIELACARHAGSPDPVLAARSRWHRACNHGLLRDQAMRPDLCGDVPDVDASARRCSSWSGEGIALLQGGILCNRVEPDSPDGAAHGRVGEEWADWPQVRTRYSPGFIGGAPNFSPCAVHCQSSPTQTPIIHVQPPQAVVVERHVVIGARQPCHNRREWSR